MFEVRGMRNVNELSAILQMEIAKMSWNSANLGHRLFGYHEILFDRRNNITNGDRCSAMPISDILNIV